MNECISELSRRNFVALGGAAVTAAMAAGSLVEAAHAGETTPVAQETYEADVVIAGAGASGMWAAVEAARAGKSVIVVEKGGFIGLANGALAGGPFVVGSAQQIEAGIDLTVDEAFHHIMDWAHWSINAPVVRACLELSGSTADAFTEDFGIPTFMRPDNYGAGHASVRHGFGSAEASVRGEDRFLPMQQWCEERGVQFIFDCALESLIVEDGACSGMNCVMGDGTAVQVLGKKTLVATGGFLGNEQMMIERFGTKVNPLGNTLSDGAGIEAVVAAGGMYGTQWGIAGNEFTGSTDKTTPVYDRKNPAFCCGIYGTLLLNHQGRRFANEGRFANFPLAIGGAISLVGGSYYAVVDQAYVDALEGSNAYVVDGSNAEQWPTGKMTLDGKTLEGVQAGFDTAIAEGWGYKGDTLEELGEILGLPSFAGAVDEYNEACAAGVDERFGKPSCFLQPVTTAPFYALEFQPSAWVTIGGVRTNDRLQAIDNTGAVIENLFVAGADNGSTISAPYCDYEGTSLMTAYNAGRLAGMWMVEDIDAE